MHSGQRQSEIGKYAMRSGQRQSEIGKYAMRSGQRQSKIGKYAMRSGQRQSEIGKYAVRSGQRRQEMNIARIMGHGNCTAKTCNNGKAGRPMPDSSCLFKRMRNKCEFIHCSLTRTGYRLMQRVEARYYGHASARCEKKSLGRNKCETIHCSLTSTRTGCLLMQRVEASYYGHAHCEKKEFKTKQM